MKKNLVAYIMVFALISLFGPDCNAGGAKDTASAIPTINVYGAVYGPSPRGLPEVEAAINAIIEKEIGVRVKLIIFEGGSFAQQVSLALSSQEKADLVLTSPGGATAFNVMVAQNQLMDIAGLLDQYGQELLKATDAVIPGYINAARIGDKIYGVGGFYNKVLNTYFLAREDILKKHNISIAGLKTLDDVETVLAKLKTAEPNMAVLVPANSAVAAIIPMEGGSFFEDFAHPVNFDIFGSIMAPLAVGFESDPYRAVNIYQSPHYKKMLERVRRWYQAGYVYRDAVINTEQAEILAKMSKGIAWITGSELGVETNKTAQVGFPITAHKITPGLISTASMIKFAWGVPSYSKEGAAAIKFLNLMYTDKRIVNLLTNGIEGRDYVTRPNGTIAYPAGVTAQTVPYHMVEFHYGNQFLMHVWEGNPPDLRQQALKENQGAPVSATMGFLFNPGPVQNEVSAVTNVLGQYRSPLESGSVDPETELPKFLKALDDAGAQKIIDETQKQLDAWRTANKK
jgi:putative aldouronate transport system substrate-binding protein